MSELDEGEVFVEDWYSLENDLNNLLERYSDVRIDVIIQVLVALGAKLAFQGEKAPGQAMDILNSSIQFGKDDFEQIR